MESEILKIVGQIAGIGGIAIGALIIIFREIIRKNIFPQFTKEHGYKIIRLIAVLVWSVAIVGIGAWVYVKVSESRSSASPQIEPKEHLISGIVKDSEGKAIADVNLSIIGQVERTLSTTSGSFRLITNSQQNTVRLQANKDGYKSWNEDIGIPNANLIIQLETSVVPQTKITENKTLKKRTSDKNLPQKSIKKQNNSPPIIVRETITQP